MNRKQRRAKTKTDKTKTTEETKKPYSPLNNSNDQPFKEHMLHLKEAHDIGHLMWLLNTGRLILPHHTHDKVALNDKLPFDEIEENYYKTNPNIVVIDDFMNLEALSKLKDYCLEYPFWNTIYGRGYLGAFREQGFSPAVLTTLSYEMIKSMPKIFDNNNKRNLSQMWAFKYESKCPGIDIHADFAAVNVNFNPGFDSKRINVTMLFGNRENTGVEPQNMLEAAELRDKTSTPVLELLKEKEKELELL